MHWTDYEELVKNIHETLGKAAGVKIICWGRCCTITGKSGAKHQIDVLTKHSVGPSDYRTAISCKYWKEKVGIGAIRDWIGVVTDAQMDKGVVVSQMGFTQPAKQLAESANIGLVELRRPLDKDWEGVIRRIHIRFLVEPPPRITDFKLHVKPRGDTPPPQSISFVAPVEECFVTPPDQPSLTLQSIIEAQLARKADGAEHNITFPQGSTFNSPEIGDEPAHEYPITGVSFKTEQLPPVEGNLTISADDHVFMIMESVFEGRKYTLSPDGTITSLYEVEQPPPM